MILRLSGRYNERGKDYLFLKWIFLQTSRKKKTTGKIGNQIVKQTRAGRAGCENTVEARMRLSVRSNLHSHYKSQLPNTCVKQSQIPRATGYSK